MFDWDVQYWHEQKDGTLAQTRTKQEGCVCDVSFCTDWVDLEVTDKRVRDTAKHEAIHLLLDRLSGLAYTRFTTASEVKEQEERIVTILEKLEIV